MMKNKKANKASYPDTTFTKAEKKVAYLLQFPHQYQFREIGAVIIWDKGWIDYPSKMPAKFKELLAEAIAFHISMHKKNMKFTHMDFMGDGKITGYVESFPHSNIKKGIFQQFTLMPIRVIK